MIAPFFKFGMFGTEASLVVAFVIGIGFGFILERAGFGNARKLAAQFYFQDLRVLKVMFTAIVTAMVGVYALSRVGFLDLSKVYLVPTLLVPDIVGGLLLGMGFVVGGYCPGTSCVSASTGRVDGMVYVAGMFAGLVGFGEVYPKIQSYATMTPMGHLTIAKYFDIPYGLLVFAVVVMALAAFVAAEWAERKFGDGSAGTTGGLLESTRRLTPARILALGLFVLGLFALVGGDPYRGNTVSIDPRALALSAGRGVVKVSPGDLADSIVKGTQEFRVIDLRPASEYAAYHIPSAENIPLAALAPDSVSSDDKVVLYSDSDLQAAQAWFILRASGDRAAYILAGGLDAWKDQVLYPVRPAKPTALEAAAFEKRAAVSRYLGGAPRAAGASSAQPVEAVPAMVVPVAPPSAPEMARPKKRAAREGC